MRLSVIRALFHYLLFFQVQGGRILKSTSFTQSLHSDGSLDANGIKILAAVEMATDDWNREYGQALLLQNGVNFVRENSLISGTTSALDEVSNAFNGTGIDLSFGPSSTETTFGLAITFQDFGIIDFGWSTDDKFSDVDFTNYVRVIPNNGLQGSVAAGICANFRWMKVAVLSTNDNFGSAALIHFSVVANSSGVDILTSVSFATGLLNYKNVIKQVKDSYANVFVLLMGAADTAVLLQQGYDEGLFVEGSQIIVTSFANTNDTWGSLSPRSVANVLMKGIISVQSAINMSDPHTIDFVHRYRSLPPSVIVDKTSNKQTCVNTTDGDHASYIYKIWRLQVCRDQQLLRP